MSDVKRFISGCSGLALSSEEKSFFSDEQPWGLILFKRNCETPEQVKALTDDFRAAVGRSKAPVLVDQEGGRVQRLGPPSNVWRRYPAARNFSRLYQSQPLQALRAARNLGRLMAEDLTSCGINVNCLPVLDVPQAGAHDVIGDRAYALKIEEIIALARAHTAGMMEGGVLPVMKHIPGHGRAMVDSHHELPVVKVGREELEAMDFVPFAALSDLPMAMSAHVVYTALDSKAPATLSKRIVKTIIRGQINFQGLLITDDLSMKALSGTLAERAVAAQAAGVDVLLHCSGKMDEMRQVAAAALPLKGKSAGRAASALRLRRKPQRFDQKLALQDWDRLQDL